MYLYCANLGGRVREEPWYADIFFFCGVGKFKTFCLALSGSCVSVQFSKRTCQPTEFHCFVKMCVRTGNFLIGIDPNLKWNVWLWLFIENTMKQLALFFSFGKNNFQTFGRKPFTEQIYGLKSCSQWNWWEFCCWLSCSHFTEVFFAAGGIVWLSIWRYWCNFKASWPTSEMKNILTYPINLLEVLLHWR